MGAGLSASGSGFAARRQPGWRSRLRAWRARQVARPEFRRFVQRMPLTRAFSRSREADLFSIATGFVQSQVLFAALFYAGASPAFALPIMFRHRWGRTAVLFRRPHPRPTVAPVEP